LHAAGQIAYLSIDDDAWGWNIGALVYASRRRPRSVVSYRSAIQYHTEGKVEAEQ
jgi:long-subunit fatty acid transport protein